MPSSPLISICIPAYGRAHLLRRLLDSIVAQTFTDFDVVVTDNSPDSSVAELCAEFTGRLPLQYFRNEQFLEMGANWNACMQRGSGQWLKMMHDDDWFAAQDSLAAFAAEARRREKGFIFSGYFNVPDGGARGKAVILGSLELAMLKRSAYSIFRGQPIGVPSVTMVHRTTFRPFTASMKWMVDMDGNLRMLQLGHGIGYIASPQICVGIHAGQATSQHFRNPVVEVYENCLMLQPYYPDFCRNVFAYDYCWRLMRNMDIRDEQTLRRFSRDAPVPPVFSSIIAFQRRLPRAFLRNGMLSKACMLLHYLYFNAAHVRIDR